MAEGYKCLRNMADVAQDGDKDPRSERTLILALVVEQEEITVVCMC